MTLKHPALLCMTITLSLGLAACSGRDATTNGSDSSSGDMPETISESSRASRTEAESGNVAATGLTLASGPDVCFRAIANHLGADTKVSEITSFFSVGSEIDSSESGAEGEMKVCMVSYQNPDDPRKLLSKRMDVKSGEFGPPIPVEITVAGGNAAEFNLEDYLISLSKVNAAGLTSVMNAQKAKLGGVYGRYAWSGIRLSAPGAFSNSHTLRLDVTGRLASNDIKENGYASVTTDAKTITTNHLMP